MQNLSKIGTTAELQIDKKRTIRYLKSGKGAPIVLLHTIRTQLDYFEYVIPELAKHFTVYALDIHLLIKRQIMMSRISEVVL